MANIAWNPGVDAIIGSRRGVTFDNAQGGSYAKKRPTPVNHNTTPRSNLRKILKETNAYYWALTAAQRQAWATWAQANGITGPYGMLKDQQGCAGFYALLINARLAGDSYYITPPGNIPITGVTYTNLTRTDKDTIRATFNPSPAGATLRIYLRQALPGPGVRRWEPVDGYIAERSALNPTSPYDFTTHFQHLTGWNCRYWTGTQENTGRRSTETLWEL